MWYRPSHDVIQAITWCDTGKPIHQPCACDHHMTWYRQTFTPALCLWPSHDVIQANLYTSPVLVTITWRDTGKPLHQPCACDPSYDATQLSFLVCTISFTIRLAISGRYLDTHTLQTSNHNTPTLTQGCWRTPVLSKLPGIPGTFQWECWYDHRTTSQVRFNWDTSDTQFRSRNISASGQSVYLIATLPHLRPVNILIQWECLSGHYTTSDSSKTCPIHGWN